MVFEYERRHPFQVSDDPMGTGAANALVTPHYLTLCVHFALSTEVGVPIAAGFHHDRPGRPHCKVLRLASEYLSKLLRFDTDQSLGQ